MYSGVSRKSFELIWRNKNLVNDLTNVTSDKLTALDYSYDYETG